MSHVILCEEYLLYTVLSHDCTQAWISQFDENDRIAAAKLLGLVRFVSSDEFRSGLTNLLDERLKVGALPIALYNEVERGHRKGVAHRLFKESRSKVKRASGGPGPALVPRQRNIDEKVGSEAIVANILTQFHKPRSQTTALSPGPDIIRDRKIRRFILVTDFIGSGNRALRFLDAAWRVRSVRSWWSRRSRTGLCFEVIAFAALPSGIAKVERHPCRPYVTACLIAPTIRSTFLPGEAKLLEALCHRYPVGAPNPLGYGDGGALIAFAHSMPNNAPAVFWSQVNGWRPLFPARTTTGTTTPFEAGVDATSVEERLLLVSGLASHDDGAVHISGGVQISIEMIVLSALRRAPRNTEAISGRLGLGRAKVDAALAELRALKWISTSNQITERGRIVLKRIHDAGEPKLLPPSEPGPYYPKSLRAPRDV